MTTLTQVISDVLGMSVSGVTRTLALGETPPESLPTADLPAMYLLDVQDGYAPLTWGEDVTRRIQLVVVIAIEPTGQSTLPTVFQTAVGLSDAYISAFQDLEQSVAYRLECTVDTGTSEVGGNTYRSLIITVTAEV